MKLSSKSMIMVKSTLQLSECRFMPNDGTHLLPVITTGTPVSTLITNDVDNHSDPRFKTSLI